VTYTVVLTNEAQDDLVRLFDFVVERELARGSGDLDLAQRAVDAVRDGLKLLERFPFTCRKAGASSLVRELVIPFDDAGYVALFEIRDTSTVVVAAVRHQTEDDYH
jgi:plasmid stabilization system protein ParE